MKTEALLENLPDRRFRVTGSGRFVVSGEGNTPDEAIAAFQRAARAAKVITVELDDEHLLSRKRAGDEVSEETWQEFLDILQQQREADNTRFEPEDRPE